MVRELLLRLVVSRREMRHQALDANVLELGQRNTKVVQRISTNAEAPHAGIDLHMDGGSFVRILSGAVKRLNQVEPVNDRRQLMFEKRLLLSRPKSAKTQNRPRNSGLPQLDTLFRQRQPKPIGGFAFQAARAFDRAVTVGIRLYRGENLRVRTYLIFDDVEIMRERCEIDLGPGWSSCFGLCEGRVIHGLRRLHRLT